MLIISWHWDTTVSQVEDHVDNNLATGYYSGIKQDNLISSTLAGHLCVLYNEKKLQNHAHNQLGI